MASHLRPLAEQIIVLTGASSGIGLCTAQLAAERGARLVLVARSGDVLEQLVAEIAANGGTAIAAIADVADRAQMDEVARIAIAEFGRIDTWINNAGVSVYGRLDQVMDEDHRKIFETNFWGVVNGSLAALPYLQLEGGALINLGSEVSEAVVPLQGMYSASKHAVKGFTDALRVEVEQTDARGVSVTLIQPTAVNTPFPHNARNYLDQEPQLPDPMIDPQDVAESILKAATEGGRDVKVGAMSTFNTAIAKMVPWLGDWMSSRQTDRQQSTEKPRRPEGTLYEPGHSGRIHGRALHT
ncbi:SDR family oxidoreductase [Variovorax ginsengisoli]|uniref:Short-subunit dehydrogenase n=1 Tax=Variovorax ginsengisoli TaxID=363844 RepID=A0ABT9S5G0_9BURK|nr:SDR family oxidoreductase [Variovorax ginsengisoli]MDP9899594.1 short-subunit dehydrogenase [Variovorax ginsengisoli]